jgi:hypothetical protein
MVRWEWALGTVSAEEELTVLAAPPAPPPGAYFTTAELRAQDAALADPVRFPDAQLDAMRQLVEQSLEDACDVGFVPRASTATPSRTAGPFGGDGSRWLSLPVHMLRSVVSVTSDGQVLDLTGVAVRGHCLWLYDGWPWGVANLTVTYSHGYDAPPLRVKRAALILAKVWLLEGPVDVRATQVSAGDGSTINLATPGVLGSTFGVPEVDAVVRQYRVPDARLT